MSAIAGIKFLIMVNVGTADTPAFAVIGGQKGATLNRTADEIDASSKDSDGWGSSLAGLRKWSIEGDGLLYESDAALTKLEKAFAAGEQILVQLTMPWEEAYQGAAYITDLSIEAPDDAAATIKYTLSGCGKLETVTA